MGSPHGLDNIAPGEVDGLGRAQAAEVLLVLGPGCGDDVRARPRCHLDRESPEAPGASHDQEHRAFRQRGGVKCPQGGHACHR